MKRPIAIVVYWLVFAALGLGMASAADWSLVQMSGSVAIEVGGTQTVSLSAGATLPPGGVLKTGANSRAMLVRAAEQMIVGPNAVIALPPGSQDRQFTNIIQGAGVVEFTVEKRNVKHFAVTTPQLAAVVKGTHFAVAVFKSSGVVKVSRGRVEVTALASGEVADVMPGQEAVVGADGSLSLSGAGALSPIRQGVSPLVPQTPTTTAAVDGNGASVVVPGVGEVSLSGEGVNAELLDLLGVDSDAVTISNDGISVDLLDVLGLDADAGAGVGLDIGGVHLGLGN